jgi:hypothetical protein
MDKVTQSYGKLSFGAALTRNRSSMMNEETWFTADEAFLASSMNHPGNENGRQFRSPLKHPPGIVLTVLKQA